MKTQKEEIRPQKKPNLKAEEKEISGSGGLKEAVCLCTVLGGAKSVNQAGSTILSAPHVILQEPEEEEMMKSNSAINQIFARAKKA